MTITALPPWPTTNDPAFDSKADAVAVAMPNFVTEVNDTAAAMNFNSTNGTSSTSVLIGTGSKSFTASTGKSWQLGMTLKIASTASPTNSMTGDVTAYNSGSGALTVNVTAFSGSGTLASWTISQSGVSALTVINSDRNKLLNGAMLIAQEFGGNPTTPTGNRYVIDCWNTKIGTASKLTFQQVADAPAGFRYSLKVTVAVQTAPSATHVYALQQPIEGLNIIDLDPGLSTAKTITLSLWIKGSVAGTYSCSLANFDKTRSYIGTVTVTTGWAEQLVTLVMDTAGTWNIDNDTGLIFRIDLGSGTNFQSTAGTWQAGDFLRTSGSIVFVNQTAGATLNITGAQLIAGDKVQAFEHKTFADQLLATQRYWEKSYEYAVLPGAVTDTGIGLAHRTGAVTTTLFNMAFKRQKRFTPTVTYYNPTTGTINQIRNNSAATNIAITSSSFMSENTTGSADHASEGSINNRVSGHWVADARMNIV